MIFVDTSALYALLDETDPRHEDAASTLKAVEAAGAGTSNYVAVESAALVERRLGRRATMVLFDLLSPMEIVWVDEPVHRAATAAFLQRGADGPSLVDCASFEVMRLRGIDTAFAFDRHFADAGFELAD
ncbi:MAG TPA: PIN domain-containing protein [Gaiella sp.]|nr:PIN domain-containing protein [Gaiella sp.]